VRLDYDSSTDQAYISLKEIADGEAVAQIVCDDERLYGEIIIDLDRDGRVLGFEFPGSARSMLPSELVR
jgi:uncharacterized protein YuzE